LKALALGRLELLELDRWFWCIKIAMGFLGPKWYPLTLWLFNIAMENGPFIVDFPIKNGDFPWLC
jgi:hypothetical protein